MKFINMKSFKSDYIWKILNYNSFYIYMITDNMFSWINFNIAAKRRLHNFNKIFDNLNKRLLSNLLK